MDALAEGRSNWGLLLFSAAALAVALGYSWLHRANPEDLFWKPVVDTPGPVLVAVGDHPNGPPTLPDADGNSSTVTPVPSSDSSQTVPFADTVTIARVVGALEARNKQVLIRRGNSSSFSDLREGAVVLIGAFNNEWSLRLTRQLALTAWPWTRTSTLSIFGTQKTRLRATGAGPPISRASR